MGTVETVLVDVKDQLGTLLTLNGTQPRYDVRTSVGNYVIQDAVATNDGLTAHCVIDTTGWIPGHYYLYVRFNALPDIPRLGPLEFKVNP